MAMCYTILYSVQLAKHTHVYIELDGGRQGGREGARKDGGWEQGERGGGREQGDGVRNR